MPVTSDKGLEQAEQSTYGIDRGCLGQIVVGLSWLGGWLGWLELVLCLGSLVACLGRAKMRSSIGKRCVLRDNKYLGWLGLSSDAGVFDSNGREQSIIPGIVEASRHPGLIIQG